MEHTALSSEKVNIFVKDIFFSLSFGLGSEETCTAVRLASEKPIATETEMLDDVLVTRSSSSILDSSNPTKVIPRYTLITYEWREERRQSDDYGQAKSFE